MVPVLQLSRFMKKNHPELKTQSEEKRGTLIKELRNTSLLQLIIFQFILVYLSVSHWVFSSGVWKKRISIFASPLMQNLLTITLDIDQTNWDGSLRCLEFGVA